MDRLTTYRKSLARLWAQLFSKKKRVKAVENDLLPYFTKGMDAISYVDSLIKAGMLHVDILNGNTLLGLKLHLYLATSDIQQDDYFTKPSTEEMYAQFFRCVRIYINFQRSLKQGNLLRKVDEGVFDSQGDITRDDHKKHIMNLWNEFPDKRTITFMVFDSLESLTKLYFTGFQNADIFRYDEAECTPDDN